MALNPIVFTEGVVRGLLRYLPRSSDQCSDVLVGRDTSWCRRLFF